MSWRKLILHFVAVSLGMSAKVGGEPIGRPHKDAMGGAFATKHQNC